MQSGSTASDGPAHIDREQELDLIVRHHGCASLWELSTTLATWGMSVDTLTSVLTTLDADTARAALVRIAAVAELSIPNRDPHRVIATTRPARQLKMGIVYEQLLRQSMFPAFINCFRVIRWLNVLALPLVFAVCSFNAQDEASAGY